MIRVLIFLAVVLAVAFGASWLADHPGTVAITFGGREYLFSTLFGLVAVLAAAVVLLIVWSLIRFLFQIPSLVSVASANRRRQRGYAALSRGMVAIGSGDADSAARSAGEAARLLPREPMTLLLTAQSAQLSGDRDRAEQTFTAMLDHPETRALALRGLHMEALRRGDTIAALQHAEAAQKIGTLPWASTAMLQARATAHDWAGALRIVDRNVGARIIDRPTGNRQRAVLLTGLAQDTLDRNPEEALEAAREALKLAPTLVPAAVLAGKLLGQKGDLRRATRVIEAAYSETPHPDLANVYLHLRHGDSARDRYARAETLARLAPQAPESRLVLAHAAIETRDFPAARAALAPMMDAGDTSRPTRRACLTMADIEETENGETGALYEWLQRASRAAPDPAWIADGVVAETWAPISPVNGRLDAYRWEIPQDRPAAVPYAHGRPRLGGDASREMPAAGEPTLEAAVPGQLAAL